MDITKVRGVSPQTVDHFQIAPNGRYWEYPVIQNHKVVAKHAKSYSKDIEQIRVE